MSTQQSRLDVPKLPEPWHSLFGFARAEHAYERRSDAMDFQLTDTRLADIKRRRVVQAERREAVLKYVRARGTRTTRQVADACGGSHDRAYRDLAALRAKGALVSVMAGGEQAWMVAKCST